MTHRFDRRTLLRRAAQMAVGGAAFQAVGSVLDACSSVAPRVAAAAPRAGGGLVFATEAEIGSFDVRAAGWDSTALLYARTVYDPLCVHGADGIVRPYLARSVTPNADYTRWAIRLRPGIRFHDGSPLDAAVVKANLDGLARSPLTGPFLLNMNGTRVMDPLTVQVTMNVPWVPFPSYLTGYLGHPAGLKQLADTSGRARPIGTGPFVFQEWLPGDHFTAVRNPDYWRSGLPHLDSITFRPIPEPAARAANLLAGEVQLMHSSNTQNVADFLRRPGYVQVNDRRSPLGEPDQNLIMLNVAAAPLSDQRVRTALAHAIDRRRVVDLLYDGVAAPADGPFMPGSLYYGATGYPAHDPRRARALIADYQRERGPVSFTLTGIPTTFSRQRNELLRTMWLDVGIQAQLVEVDQATLIQQALTGRYQACVWRQFGSPDPDANYAWWSSATSAPVGRQALNAARNADPLVDAALDAGRTQVDPQVRAACYRLVAARLGADVPYLWLAPSVWIVAAHESVGGLGRASLPDGGRARDMAAGVVSTADLWRGP